MSQRYGTFVTDIGKGLIVEAMAKGEKINISKAVVGDGGGAYYMPTPDMDKLKRETWNGKINSVEIGSATNTIEVVAVIPSDVGGFTIREMAIFTDKGEMFAICNTPDTEKVILTSGAIGEMEILMRIEMSDTDAITFIVDPNVVLATKSDLEKHDKAEDAHKELIEKIVGGSSHLPTFTSTGSGAAYIATSANIAALSAGLTLVMIPHIQSTTGTPTLNLNNWGAKPIRRQDSGNTANQAAGYVANWIAAKVPVMMQYTGEYWMLVGMTKPLLSDIDGLQGVLDGKEPSFKSVEAKTSLTDADTMPVCDSEAMNTTKRITFANLKASMKTSFEGTLSNTGWSGTVAPYSKSVTVSGITSTGNPPIIDVQLSTVWTTLEKEEEAWADIKRIDYVDDMLTFYAEKTPSVNLKFKGVQMR